MAQVRPEPVRGMSTDARNSLIAWGSVLVVIGFFWAGLSFIPDWELPSWAEPYFWGLIGTLLVADIIRLALPQRRSGARE